MWIRWGISGIFPRCEESKGIVKIAAMVGRPLRRFIFGR
jgi:hypothetical protein